jgi:ketosteroid isomerase-like protein
VARSTFLDAIAAGTLVHDEMITVGEPRVRVDGDCAVLVAHVQNRGSFQGDPFSFDEWSTDTYLKTGDGWRCVVTALTPVAGAESA